jgi:hypothetical protein
VLLWRAQAENARGNCGLPWLTQQSSAWLTLTNAWWVDACFELQLLEMRHVLCAYQHSVNMSGPSESYAWSGGAKCIWLNAAMQCAMYVFCWCRCSVDELLLRFLGKCCYWCFPWMLP